MQVTTIGLDLPDIANEVIHNMSEHLMALHARAR